MAGYTSGGEQQMCAIGRALMSRPKMILLDEPSMGLAPQIVEEIFAIVRSSTSSEGVSFLLAEQNTNMALKYADYGYILENGRVVMDGPAKALRENEDVKEFYLGVAEGRAQELPRGARATSAASAGSRDAATSRVGADPRHRRVKIEFAGCQVLQREGQIGRGGSEKFHRRCPASPPLPSTAPDPIARPCRYSGASHE